MIDEEEKGVDLQSLIYMVLQNKNNFYDFLEFAYLLFSAVDKEKVTERIKELIYDFNKRRRIEVINSLKEETESKINYYMKDVGDDFDFDEDIERFMIDVKFEILDYVGEQIAEMNTEEGFDI